MKGYEKEIIDIVNSSFGIYLNANDFFQYACADAVLLDPYDFEWALPIIRKYGYEGEQAVMSKIRGILPIKPHITPKFEQALEELNNNKDIEIFSE